MNDEDEEILKLYVKGGITGEDNRLRATIGNLTAKRSEQLTKSITALAKTITSEFFNLMTNLGSHTQKLTGTLTNDLDGLNRGIENQVEKLIRSNEELGKINLENSKKTHNFTIVNIVLTIIITLTGVVGLWNIFLTNTIKDETIKTNQINEQPLLIFTDFNITPYKISNSGKGVAMNFLMVVWDKGAKQLYITPQGGVGEALAVNSSVSISPSDLVKTNFDQAKKVPGIAKLINETEKKDTSWFVIVYEDIYGNSYATLIRGPGGDYNENAKFIKL